MGFKGVFIAWTCFPDDNHIVLFLFIVNMIGTDYMTEEFTYPLSLSSTRSKLVQID